MRGKPVAPEAGPGAPRTLAAVAERHDGGRARARPSLICVALQSTLEFELHLQEFIELARERRLTQAVEYARKQLLPLSEGRTMDVQHALGALAFSPATQCASYKALFSESRWDDLIARFRRDNFAIHGLPPESPLVTMLQAGLSALKTPMCGEPANRSPNCPVCRPSINVMATKLPLSHRVRSCIVCRISGELTNEDNPPMVLPNNYVYGRNVRCSRGPARRRVVRWCSDRRRALLAGACAHGGAEQRHGDLPPDRADVQVHRMP